MHAGFEPKHPVSRTPPPSAPIMEFNVDTSQRNKRQQATNKETIIWHNLDNLR